jgi:hypothetical protein
MEAYWDFNSCGYQQDGFFFFLFPFLIPVLLRKGRKGRGKKSICRVLIAVTR